MAQNPAILIDMFIPLLIHSDPLVQRQSARLVYSSHGSEAAQQLQARLRQGDAVERQRVRAALDCLRRYVPQGALAQPVFPGLEINCLGVLQIWANGVPLLPQLHEQDRSRAGTHKVRAVLAILFEAGTRGVTREMLAEAVWGREPEASGLARVLTSLRSLITEAGGEALTEAVLLISDNRLLLHPDHVRSDVASFARLCTLAAEIEGREGLAAAAELYVQALALYRGPYMADVPTTWGALIERRSMLSGDFLNLSERLAEHYFTQGRFHACEQICSHALAEDLSADDLTVWLLRAHAQIGHYAEVEHAYQRYLRIARVRPDSASDPVVRAYGELRQVRVVG